MEICYWWLLFVRNYWTVLWEKVAKDPNQAKYRGKAIYYMSNGKAIIIHIIAGLIKKRQYENESIFSLTI